MSNSTAQPVTHLARVFLEPTNVTHRQYEALRAYFVDGLPSHEAAERFGYTPGSFRVLCHQFRQNPKRPFFMPTAKGPAHTPKKKDDVREQIVALRKQNLSIYDISRSLKNLGHHRSPAMISVILKEEGFARLHRRRDEERVDQARPTHADVADARQLNLVPRSFRTRFGGLFLFLPYLARIPFDDILDKAGFPGTKMIPAGQAMRSLLALKLFANARQRVFCYANGAVSKEDQDDEILRFVEFWKQRTGKLPEELVFDSRLTTYGNLDRLNGMGIRFLTLRRRSKRMLHEIHQKPLSVWRRIELKGIARTYRTPRILDAKIGIRNYTEPIRQLTIADLGHEEPTLLLTNHLRTSAAKLITRYAQRMIIENEIADGIDFFHMDALSSAVAMKVNCDLQLTLMGSSLYKLLGRQIGNGYERAKSRHLFRDLVDATARVEITAKDIYVYYQKRAHNPLLLAAGFDKANVRIPWLGHRRLRLIFG